MSESLRGNLLVAGKRLYEPNFFKTVVLIVEHGSEGAMGLVVNRPSSVTVANALQTHFELPDTEDPVYVGGPVEPSALFILHDADKHEEDERSVVPGLFVGSSADVFEAVVKSVADGDPEICFRIYSGCAGWAPNQLESEVKRGDWHLLPATLEAVFADDPYNLWDESLQRVYEANRILPHLVQDPEWN